MEEIILPPSPNWFLVSGIAASCDNWLFYGGPSKGLCVLTPINSELNVVNEKINHTAHLFHGAHPEKITSVDISPEWPTKRSILSGSVDGLVKEFNLSHEEGRLQIKVCHIHEVHSKAKEEVVSVGYSNENYAVTVGCYGNIVKWDYIANVVKSYNHLIRNFKPTAMVCSKHILLNVAVGTKQGVVFVLDLKDSGSIVYKVRAHDNEISSMSWCPQYEVEVKKLLKESVSSRMDRIRNEPEPECEDILLETNASTSQTDTVNINTNVDVSKVNSETDNDTSLNESEILEEEDLFGVYKDHEADEFGHKKYQPKEIRVKLDKTVEEGESDFLTDCVKLKRDLLQRKEQNEVSIDSLVMAFDKTSINQNEQKDEHDVPSSVHIQRHMLATIGKQGSIRVWSKTGKLVSSSVVPNANNHSQQRSKSNSWLTLLWYKPDVLLLADGKSQLLECNPLAVDCKNKLEHHVLHTLHRRGLFCIISTAPRVQTSETEDKDWIIWTASQDRYLVAYSLRDRKMLRTYATCAGFIYDISVCPYNVNKISISVGDGAVRVWHLETGEENGKLKAGIVTNFWQNVQGKVLTSAWHPIKENLLAFATAEARVGLIDTSSIKTEKPAKVLPTVLGGAIYGLCWGEHNNLYACGAGTLVMYNTGKGGGAPEVIPVELEGKKWQLSDVYWHKRALLVGSHDGAVGVMTLTQPHTIITAAFPYNKMIHNVDWHPAQVSTSDAESPNKNLIAACALDKEGDIAILQITETDDGGVKLLVKKYLRGHTGPVFRVAWSPHEEGYLLSASKDGTVRAWDVGSDLCVSVVSARCRRAALCAVWSGRPDMARAVLWGGADSCLRVSHMDRHPPELYQPDDVGPKPWRKAPTIDFETSDDIQEAPKRKYRSRQKPTPAKTANDLEDEENDAAATYEKRSKASKKYLLPLAYRQIQVDSINGCRKLLDKYIKCKSIRNGNGDVTEDVKSENDTIEIRSTNGAGEANSEFDCDYIQLFGTMNEVNEFIEIELDRHIQATNYNHWIMLSIFRGHIDEVFQFAAQRNIITPYLLSLAPCVSFKYWKDATQLFLTQLDRHMATDDDMLFEHLFYGGPVYMKVATLLSVHDLKGAVETLLKARLFKEAYLLCRVRYMESVAQDVLKKWATEMEKDHSMTSIAASCYIALGDLTAAATALGKSKKEDHLMLSADIYKLCGQTTYAENIMHKSEVVKSHKEPEDVLPAGPLPSKSDVIVADVQDDIS